MSTYTVRALRWRKGWELHIEGEGVTQCRTLDQAEDQVRDYLATVHDKDFSDALVEVTPDLGGLEVKVGEVRAVMHEADELRTQAARGLRDVTQALRRSGLSVTDTATVLKVSRGRVSQLVGLTRKKPKRELADH